MAARSKRKGNKVERDIVKRWIAAGLEARRVVLSGALGSLLGDDFHGDVKVVINDHAITVQSKSLANGWASLYRDIEGHDCLIIKANHKESLVILPESLFLALVGTPDGECGVQGGVQQSPAE